MANREETVLRLRREFVSEWAQMFPDSPCPPVRALAALDGRGKEMGVSLDNWLEAGAVDQLRKTLHITDNKMCQLQAQLSRKAFLRNFLLNLLHCLEPESEQPLAGGNPLTTAVSISDGIAALSSHSSSVITVSSSSSSAITAVSSSSSSAITAVSSSTSSTITGVSSSPKFAVTALSHDCPVSHTFSSSSQGREGSGVSGLLRTGADCLESCVVALSTVTRPPSVREGGVDQELAQCDGAPFQGFLSRREGLPIGLNIIQNKHITVSCASSPCPDRPITDWQSVTSERCRPTVCGSHNDAPRQVGLRRDGPCVVADQVQHNTDTQRPTQCNSVVIVEQQRYKTRVPSPTSKVTVRPISVEASRHSDSLTTRHSQSLHDRDGSDCRKTCCTEEPQGKPERPSDRPPDRPTGDRYSAPCLAVQGLVVPASVFGSPPPPTPAKVTVPRVEFVTCATQTDISLGVCEEQRVPWYPDLDAERTVAMFGKKKKQATGGRRGGGEEEGRGDRDNSGVLGKYSQVRANTATPSPPRHRSPQHVQYLQLTDGFNIVLGSGGADSGAGNVRSRSALRLQEEYSDSADSLEDEVYDNNTTPPVNHRSAVAEHLEEHAPGRERGEGGRPGLIKARSIPIAPQHSSSSPTPSRSHPPVSRVISDTTGLRIPPPPPPKPPAHLRSHLPHLPPHQQKPSAVIHVDQATRDSPGIGNDGRGPESDGNDTGQNVNTDQTTCTCRESGRGHHAASCSVAERASVAAAATHVLPHNALTTTTASDSSVFARPAVSQHSVHTASSTPDQKQTGGGDRTNVTTDLSDPTTTTIAIAATSTTATTNPTPASLQHSAAAALDQQHHNSNNEEDKDATALPSAAGSDGSAGAVLACDRDSPMSGSSPPQTDSRKPGVADLCQASASRALEISQRLSAAAATEQAEGDRCVVVGGPQLPAGQSNRSSQPTAVGQAVENYYESREGRGQQKPTARSETIESSVIASSSPSSSALYGGGDHIQDGGDTTISCRQLAVTAAEDPSSAMELLGHHHQSDTGSAGSSPHVAIRRPKKSAPPPPVPKDSRRQRERAYENWTLDRAITANILDSFSDDDDDDDGDGSDSTTSPEGTLERFPSKGSKDSGLCLDVQTSGAPETGSGSVTVSDSAVSGRPVNRLKDGRISSLDELNRLHDEEDYVNVSLVTQGETTDQDDNISIASDIVFIPGSKVTDSSESPELAREHREDRTPSITSDDELDSFPSADSSYDDGDGIEGCAPASPRDNMLKMRQLLVTGVLETERSYLATLELLLHYKKTLEASCRTSQPVISEDDIISIFGNLQQLQEIHKEFVEGLQEKVNNWFTEQTIGDVFKCLVVMFPEFGKYAANYQKAVATIHTCAQDNQRFQELAQQIVFTSTTREETSLEDALFKPVQRLQRNTLVLHDLIKHTPEDHPDHETLQKALSLSQHNLENFGTCLMPGHQKVEERRNLVKSSFVVELVSGWRKIRFIFLFSDLLVCTKREQHRGGKVTFACKWFIPMNSLIVDTKFAYQDDTKFFKKDDTDELKRRLRGLKTELKTELRKEMKKEEKKDKHWSIGGIATSRSIEKLKKKIQELEGELILASPRLPFKVWLDSGKVHTLLMTTDYEREEWREVITSLRRKSARTEAITPSAYEVQEVVNSVKELPQVNKIGSMIADSDEDAIYGTLNVTIHKMDGLQDSCDTYCCLEMDSYGHFFMKARTRICSHSAEPSWNEDFELELEGSQTLRVLCYRKLPEKQGDVLLGRGALEMSKEWLKAAFQEKTVVMNEYSLVLSVRYTAAEKTMRRTPSKQSTAVFGVRISACAKREGKTVPTIVTACVQEVEKRGMDEKGIYRVSGVTSDVQKLKKHFDKNVKIGVSSVGDVDINSVTGVLKLYLRELPDPLFTEANYGNFIDALKLSDAEGKVKCMLSLLHNLPDINYYTAVYLLEHLYRVSQDEKENKMSIHNLSTIFGPTLLAPPVKATAATMSEMISIGAEQCMKQSAVVYYFLGLLASGVSLRRSSASV